jgi:proteic killer suppression protein
MEFSFSGKLKKLLSSEKAMRRTFGDRRAKALQLRLGVLANAKTLADVPVTPPVRCHQLTGDRKGQFAVVLVDNWRLVFEPDPAVKGTVDLTSVKKIRLLEIVDYHGK